MSEIFYQWSQKQIADHLGISQQRVSDILSRSKAILAAYEKIFKNFLLDLVKRGRSVGLSEGVNK